MSNKLIWKDKKGIVKCDTSKVEPGTTLELDGEIYYIAKNRDDAKKNMKFFGGEYAANRICTSYIVYMGEMFSGESKFNEDIGNCDMSNVKDIR